LNDLALEMKQTLKQLLMECVTAGQSSEGAVDPSLFPSQVRELMFATQAGMVLWEDPLPAGRETQIMGSSVLSSVWANAQLLYLCSFSCLLVRYFQERQTEREATRAMGNGVKGGRQACGSFLVPGD
jgi:hypothetical protein